MSELDRHRPPRRVEINGHQEYFRGVWHGWITDSEGQVKAIVETERGTITYVDPYKLTFIA